MKFFNHLRFDKNSSKPDFSAAAKAAFGEISKVFVVGGYDEAGDGKFAKIYAEDPAVADGLSCAHLATSVCLGPWAELQQGEEEEQ